MCDLAKINKKIKKEEIEKVLTIVGLDPKLKTIVLASHNREDIEILCDQVYEMDDGVLSEYTAEDRI